MGEPIIQIFGVVHYRTVYHQSNRKSLRALISVAYDVIYGTVNRCAHVFYDRTMSFTVP